VKRYSRHFARDVALHFTAVLAVVLAICAIQILFRSSVRMSGPEDAGAMLARTGEEIASMLHAGWPFICTIGLCSAMAQWSRRRQDQLVAMAGQPFRRYTWIGLLLILTLLVGGTLGLGSALPDADSRRISWSDGECWGAALRQGDEVWEWTEVRRENGTLGIRRERASSPGELPPPARAALIVSNPSRSIIWNRIVFLLLLAGLMLRAMHLQVNRVTLFAVIGPLAGGFLWIVILRSTSTLVGSSPLAAVAAPVIAAVLIATLGLGMIRWAKP
jgi:hypothetical protein